MNKALFGLIGLLLLGVIGVGTEAAYATLAKRTPLVGGEAAPTATSTPAVATSTPALTPAPTPAPPPVPAPNTYTLAQVAAHNSSASCYTAIDGSVYDVTPFIHMHPGGAGAILSLCGKDGSNAFDSQHGGQRRPESELAQFKIGTLHS